MSLAFDSIAGMSVFSALAAGLAAALVSVLTVALAAVGQELRGSGPQYRLRWLEQRYWHAGALAVVLAGLLSAGMGANAATIDATTAGAVLGAWLVRGCELTRRPCVVALLGSGMGLAVMSAGIVRYVSVAAQVNAERIELYAAVFIGAMIFATSTIAFCKLRGALQMNATMRPGHGIVNLLAMLLCAWLGYGFVTEQAPPFGLAALLAMSALACAMGVHVMISRDYAQAHIASHELHAHAFAARSDGLAAMNDRRGLLAHIEWHGGEEQAWTLRDTTPGTLRTSACLRNRHCRGVNGTNAARRHRRDACARATQSAQSVARR